MRAVGIANLGTICATAAALNVDVAAQQSGRAGIPARSVEIVSAGERIARRVVNVAVVVAGVGGAAVDEVVAAGEVDAAGAGDTSTSTPASRSPPANS
jgi:hypothetical protein